MATFNPLFEHETCSRCLGTGNYSYNQIDGTRCFKCRGHKVVLTKRGFVAQQFLHAMRESPAGTLQPGMKCAVEMFAPGGASATRVRPVLEVRRHPEENRVDVVWDCLILQARPSTPVKRHYEGVQAECQRQIALAYQACLTKTGTFRKGPSVITEKV